MVSFLVAGKKEDFGDHIPIASKTADQAWTQRQCRSIVDMKGIIEEIRRENDAVAHLTDDSLPSAYPTMHFGESIFSAMLGGDIKFVGTASHTCSGAEPLIEDWQQLKNLSFAKNQLWTKRYLDSLQEAVRLNQARDFFWHFVTIDTLNLAVELRGKNFL